MFITADIEPETMMQAWLFPITADIEEMLKRNAHVKSEPAKVEEYAALLCKGWDKRFSGA